MSQQEFAPESGMRGFVQACDIVAREMRHGINGQRPEQIVTWMYRLAVGKLE